MFFFFLFFYRFFCTYSECWDRTGGTWNRFRHHHIIIRLQNHGRRGWRLESNPYQSSKLQGASGARVTNCVIAGGAGVTQLPCIHFTIKAPTCQLLSLIIKSRTNHPHNHYKPHNYKPHTYTHSKNASRRPRHHAAAIEARSDGREAEGGGHGRKGREGAGAASPSQPGPRCAPGYEAFRD